MCIYIYKCVYNNNNDDLFKWHMQNKSTRPQTGPMSHYIKGLKVLYAKIVQPETRPI